MDALPLRKRKADDVDAAEQTPAAVAAAEPPPRLALQTATAASVTISTSGSSWLDGPSALSSPSSPSGPGPAGPCSGPASSPFEPPTLADPHEPSDADPAVSSRLKRPRTDDSAGAPSSPVCAPASSSAARASQSPRRPAAAARRADELLADVRTEHGRRWHWMTSASGETRLVATFVPASQYIRPSDALLSQSAPTSPTISTPRRPLSVVIPIDPASPHIPARFPTINKDTLRELDVDSIMRNPQLRQSCCLMSLARDTRLTHVLLLIFKQVMTSSSTLGSNSDRLPRDENASRQRRTGALSSSSSTRAAHVSPSTSPALPSPARACANGFLSRRPNRLLPAYLIEEGSPFGCLPASGRSFASSSPSCSRSSTLPAIPLSLGTISAPPPRPLPKTSAENTMQSTHACSTMSSTSI
jgi:hypothetical protein